MKLALILLAVFMLVFSGPVEEKRFLEFLHLESLVKQLEAVVHSGMGHAECVKPCHALAGPLDILCDVACTQALAAVNDNRYIEHQMDILVQQLKLIVVRDMGHVGCVNECHAIAGFFSLLCDAACTKVLSFMQGGIK